jgi:hypothetical protein
VLGEISPAIKSYEAKESIAAACGAHLVPRVIGGCHRFEFQRADGGRWTDQQRAYLYACLRAGRVLPRPEGVNP